MRMLIAIVFGCALVLGFTQAGSSGRAELGAQPSYELSVPAADQAPVQAVEDVTDGVQLEGEGEGAYECKYSPYCQRASQCEAYCGGGLAVCQNGCCACAS
jgi:hypothetical protein